MTGGPAARRRWRTASALLALLALGPVGCGVPAEDRPRGVRPPPGVGLPPAAAASPAAGRVAQPICLVRDDRLVRVVRQVDVAGDVDLHLRRLLAGASSAERESGLGSALPGAVGVTGARLVDGRAEVAVAPPRDESGRADEVLAYGQVVCTLDARDDVSGVSFVRDGRPLGVPRADGSLSPGPLTAADYAALTVPS
ncbi:GerMN domain-containing protein [Micromonospora coxensis]|uniref:GerMN domain-containing protein n=1 Tax=Micromonospora coxensis TaxID=356852 RepID=UPI00342C4787